MSTNPFDRNKTVEAKLGQLITAPGEQNKRDAIHIAVVPVIAAEDLEPGTNVGVNADGTQAGTEWPHVGIADPFIPWGGRIPKGATFWLCLYQGSVHTLRHEWTHPAFPAAASDRPVVDERAMSEVWLRAYAMRIKPYDDKETAYTNFLRDIATDEVYFHGIDTDHDCKDDAELWRHVAIVTGRHVDTENLNLRCGC